MYHLTVAQYLDSVPFSGIIRIRDMMYSVENPYRLDQGDVSFDAPDTLKAAMVRAIAENRTHYLQTNGLPRLRELLAEKLRRRNGIADAAPEHVLVTNGGIHGLYIVCQAFLEPGGALLLTTCCQGGNLGIEALNLWGASNAHGGRLPAVAEMVRQLDEAGYRSIETMRLIPGDSFHAFHARR